MNSVVYDSQSELGSIWNKNTLKKILRRCLEILVILKYNYNQTKLR